MFQSTFPQGERPSLRMSNVEFKDVSIHVPTRGTTLYSESLLTIIMFQSTFPQGERHYGRFDGRPAIMFQSTFPQGERHFCVRFEGKFKNVSIHVPTRGTTILTHLQNSRRFVSIHVPTRGTTRLRTVRVIVRQFQSTFPQGERRYYGSNYSS